MSTALQELISDLRALGATHWGKDAHTYFSHSSGRVSLDGAARFYNRAVQLAEKAALELGRTDCKTCVAAKVHYDKHGELPADLVARMKTTDAPT